VIRQIKRSPVDDDVVERLHVDFDLL